MANEKLVLQVKISTPTEVLWEGEAASVSSVNSQGTFDILPKHANFVTLVKGDPPSLQRFQNYAFREGNAPHPEQDIGIGTKKEDAG